MDEFSEVKILHKYRTWDKDGDDDAGEEKEENVAKKARM